MKKINIVCVGNIKEKYLVDAIGEYAKRINKYYGLNIIEVAEEKPPAKLTDSDIKMIIEREATRIVPRLKGYVIALTIDGKKMDSVKFASTIDNLTDMGEITFVIGGSYGLGSEVVRQSKMQLSFSDMTFPHQLMRVILLEQIYRAGTIINGATYHK